MPEHCISHEQEDDLSFDEILNIVKIFSNLGITKVRITGGEPLVRKGVTKLIKDISNIESIKDISMTTNGILLNKYAEELKDAGLNRINISLDTLDEDKYREITRGGNLSTVLEGIMKAKEVGLSPIKINTVLIEDFNHMEITDLINFAEDNSLYLRFIELMPIGQAVKIANDKFVSNNRVLQVREELVAIEKEDISSPALYYKAPSGKSTIGLINPISCKFCDNCNRIRLTSKGKLKLCLHSDLEVDIKTPLREGKDISKVILDAVARKEKSHHLEEGQYIDRDMNQIGG